MKKRFFREWKKYLYGALSWIRFDCLKVAKLLRGESWLLTTKSLGVSGTHLIDHRRTKSWVDLVKHLLSQLLKVVLTVFKKFAQKKTWPNWYIFYDSCRFIACKFIIHSRRFLGTFQWFQVGASKRFQTAVFGGWNGPLFYNSRQFIVNKEVEITASTL